MTKAKQSGACKGYRYPPDIISYAVWLYFRFALSLRDVEDLLAERGIVVSYETVRTWVTNFGGRYGHATGCARPSTADKWHLDEVAIMIRGKKHCLWRAVDSEGDVLDTVVQSRRNTKVAYRFFRKLSKWFDAPRVVVTDKLRSYGAALRTLARYRPSATQGPEQSRRGFSPANPKAREDIRALQIAATSAAALSHTQSDPNHFPPASQYPLRHLIPPRQNRHTCSLARHNK